ncbi:MAG TPA: zf-HC2 domain-containing protein [Pyrinomonadaceae bacterium]|nr:zf-HC2 domain-containing protein [Pyrinomonadaceae bacterium]
MKCEGCLPLLEEYADGELDAGAAARVEAHLEDCAACARAHRKLEEERAVFLTYECDAAPARGFWDDVLAKIDAEQDARAASARPASLPARARARLAVALGEFAAPRLSPALTAALLLFAVALTVALMKYAAPPEASPARETAEATAPREADEGAAPSSPSSSPNQGGAVASNGPARGEDERARDENEEREHVGNKDEKNGEGGGRRENVASRQRGEEKLARVNRAERASVGGGEASEARRTASSASRQESAPDRLVREAEQKYLAAIRLLSRDVSSRRARLDEETRGRFEQTLAAVDRTIADTRRAAREHPRDPVAVQYMLTAYAKKVEVLREMTRY